MERGPQEMFNMILSILFGDAYTNREKRSRYLRSLHFLLYVSFDISLMQLLIRDYCYTLSFSHSDQYHILRMILQFVALRFAFGLYMIFCVKRKGVKWKAKCNAQSDKYLQEVSSL